MLLGSLLDTAFLIAVHIRRAPLLRVGGRAMYMHENRTSQTAPGKPGLDCRSAVWECGGAVWQFLYGPQLAASVCSVLVFPIFGSWIMDLGCRVRFGRGVSVRNKVETGP